MKNKAFTLIELLVVVLIIGILVAIAVPQYQVAVGKSKFATIKNLTRALADAAEVYHLANGNYPSNFNNLDISLPPNITQGYSINNCQIWSTAGDQNAVVCFMYVNNKRMAYYHFLNYDSSGRGGKDACYAMTADTNDIVNKICQKETGSEGSCDSSYCQYNY